MSLITNTAWTYNLRNLYNLLCKIHTNKNKLNRQESLSLDNMPMPMFASHIANNLWQRSPVGFRLTHAWCWVGLGCLTVAFKTLFREGEHVWISDFFVSSAFLITATRGKHRIKDRHNSSTTQDNRRYSHSPYQWSNNVSLKHSFNKDVMEKKKMWWHLIEIQNNATTVKSHVRHRFS